MLPRLHIGRAVDDELNDKLFFTRSTKILSLFYGFMAHRGVKINLDGNAALWIDRSFPDRLDSALCQLILYQFTRTHDLSLKT